MKNRWRKIDFVNMIYYITKYNMGGYRKGTIKYYTVIKYQKMK